MLLPVSKIMGLLSLDDLYILFGPKSMMLRHFVLSHVLSVIL